MATVTPQLDLGEVYAPEAVAEAFKVDKRTVYRLIHKGELFAYKIGAQYRIPAAALLECFGIEYRP
jgi:excisionase family DNA binding protein